VQEDSGSFLVYTVSLSNEVISDVDVALSLSGTATSGEDYDSDLEYNDDTTWLPLTGDLTLPADGTSVQVRVAVLDDVFVEVGETVVLSASTADIQVNNYTDIGTSTITQDIDTITGTLTATGSTSEDGGELTYTVTLTGLPGNDDVSGHTGVTVTLTNGEIIYIAAGETTGTTSIIVNRDDVYVETATNGTEDSIINSISGIAETTTASYDFSSAITPAATTLVQGFVGDPASIDLTAGLTGGIQADGTSGLGLGIAGNDNFGSAEVNGVGPGALDDEYLVFDLGVLTSSATFTLGNPDADDMVRIIAYGEDGSVLGNVSVPTGVAVFPATSTTVTVDASDFGGADFSYLAIGGEVLTDEFTVLGLDTVYAVSAVIEFVDLSFANY
jgi:hypothetical protein